MKELSAPDRSKSPIWADPPPGGHQDDDREADDAAWLGRFLLIPITFPQGMGQ